MFGFNFCSLINYAWRLWLNVRHCLQHTSRLRFLTNGSLMRFFPNPKSLENTFYHFSFFFYDLIITLSINTCMIWIHVAWGGERERQREKRSRGEVAVVTHIYSVSFHFSLFGFKVKIAVKEKVPPRLMWKSKFPQNHAGKENFLCAWKSSVECLTAENPISKSLLALSVEFSAFNRQS